MLYRKINSKSNSKKEIYYVEFVCECVYTCSFFSSHEIIYIKILLLLILPSTLNDYIIIIYYKIQGMYFNLYKSSVFNIFVNNVSFFSLLFSFLYLNHLKYFYIFLVLCFILYIAYIGLLYNTIHSCIYFICFLINIQFNANCL